MENRAKSSADGSLGAREAILASIRKNLDASKRFDAVHREHYSHSDHRDDSPSLVAESGSRNSLIDEFCGNLASVGGHYTVVKGESEAANVVESIIEKIGAKKVAISDSELVGRILGTETEHDFVKNASAEYLFDCDIGITAAQWAIAETGTLVLESDVERHRLTSLVPPVHVCLIKAKNIRRSLGEILELTGGELSRVITFITGASRTSDIELTLAIGVHGPGELHVVVIADQ